MTDQPTGNRPSAPAHVPAFRLNLEQQRNRARELQRAVRAGDPAALQRFRAHHPRGLEPGRRGRLSEAQLVIARELGLSGWPGLKAHIKAMEQARARIDHPGLPPDAGPPTLHIRCGSDLQPTLAAAGFSGDFLEYSDPFCQGPVTDTPDWPGQRAAFLARTYGDAVERTEEQITAGLQQAEAWLLQAGGDYERVVLWFEHDSYDQLILARCLAAFVNRAPSRLELISVDHFPGGMRFIGLGQLPPEALRLVWDTRRPVSPRQVALGRSAWSALRQPDPSALATLARAGTPELPQLGSALRRHCQELPWLRDGLALTQRLILQMLAEGPRRIGRLFHDLMMERDPLPFETDLMVRSMIEAMRHVREPVFTGLVDEPDAPWWRERLTITPVGRAVLAGDRDWLSLEPAERWVGGVAIRPHTPCWRWDDAAGAVVLR